MIKDKLKKTIKDKKTNINSINFKKIENQYARIEYRYKSVYKDEVTVNFTVDKSVELSTAFTDLNLGTIETNGNPLTEKMIKDKLPANIQNEVDISINSNGTTAAITAKASSTKYKGNPVTVNFTIDNKIELSTIFTENDLDLGKIDPLNEVTNSKGIPSEKIENKIQEKLNLKNIDISEVEIQNISHTQATITPKTSSTKYKGEAKFIFILKTYKVDLMKAIPTHQKRNLGTIETNGKPLTVEMIKSKLPENIRDQVEIIIQKDNKVMLKPTPDSNYKGLMLLSFKIKDIP